MIEVIKLNKIDQCYYLNKICNCYYLTYQNIMFIGYSLDSKQDYITFEYDNFINNKRIYEKCVILVRSKLKLIHLIKKHDRIYRLNDFLTTYKDYIISYQ